MQLKIGNIFIDDVQYGDATEVKGDILYVNKDEFLAEAGADERIASVDVYLAKPGEETRIIPVKDVIEPRVKVEGQGGIFPGFMSNVEQVGNGMTNVLKGAAIVTT